MMWSPLALLVVLLSSALAREPRGSESPTALCLQVQGALARDASKKEVKSLLHDAQDVDAEDVICLRRGRPPEYVLRKSQSELMRRHGLSGLPSGPVDVWAVIPDPRTIAEQQVPSVGVWLLDVGASLGVTETVEDTVTDKIVSQARAAFQEEGVVAEISLELRQLGATNGVHWPGGTRAKSAIPGGSYYVLYIHVPDAIEAARASEGDLVVWLGARLGENLEAEVRKTVRQLVWTKLADNGIPSFLVRLDD